MQYLDKNGVTKLWNAIKQKFETKDSAEQTKTRVSSAEGTVNQLSNSVRSVQIAVTELKNAKQPKLYIAYSSSSDGTGMTLTPQADSSYIGFCTSVDDIAPTTPSRYKWALFKGQGGSGGTSVYTWVAYASDNDGTDFSHTYNGDVHDWIGLGLNKPSLTASNNYHDYEWHCITDPNATTKLNQLEGSLLSLSTTIQSVQTNTESMLTDIYGQVEHLPERIDELKGRLDVVKDYIIEQGETDGWQYTKWAKGTLEMLMSKEIDSGGWTDGMWNNMLFSRKVFGYPLQIKPVKTPVVVASVQIGTGYSLGAQTTHIKSGNQFTGIQITSAGSQGASTAEVKNLQIYVIGKWK